MGQALHTLQDSFTHTFRTHGSRTEEEDGRRVTTVLNWIDFAENDHREGRDGPPHEAALDQCRDIDDFREDRVEMAIEASKDLLRAALDPSTDAEEKELAVDEVLSKWMQFEPGCDFDNRWCDAPERSYTDPTGCTCRVPFATPPGRSSAPLAFVLLGLVVALRCRLRRARRRTATLFALALVLIATTARAQDEPDAPSPPGETPTEPASAPEATETETETATATATEPATATATEHETAAEPETDTATTLADDLILVVDPADVAYAIPHLSGAPLSYRQYRLTVSLQWGGLAN
jgi:hypothetical protein